MIFTLMPASRHLSNHSRAFACASFLSVAMLPADRESIVPPVGTGAAGVVVSIPSLAATACAVRGRGCRRR